MKAKTQILFRADGNSQIGLGHVVRSLALAELLCPDFDCTFAIQNPSPEISAQIKTICPEIINLPENKTALLNEAELIAGKLTGKEIIVLDGYQFPTEYQQILKQKGSILVCLDDLHDRHFVADAIINIAGGVKPEAYSVEPYTKLYLGPAYALLRKPFREARKTLSERPSKVQSILICFGGADPENFTLKTLEKIQKTNPALNLEVVLGSAYTHTAALQNFIAAHANIRLHQNLSAEEMAILMEQCEVAITSASSVAYEYCAVNGMLFLEKTAANQHDLYEFLLA